MPLALVGAGLFGIGSGTFLAVDWALLTDIIPKVAAGRYMGISNVATASSGVVAVAVALKGVMDPVSVAIDPGTGPRAAMVVGIACYAIGALLLHPVREPRARIGDSPPPAERRGCYPGVSPKARRRRVRSSPGRRRSTSQPRPQATQVAARR